MLLNYKDFKTLSQSEMKKLRGGNPPDGGSTCQGAETPCGPTAQPGSCMGVDPHSPEKHCCCSIDGYEDECLSD